MALKRTELKLIHLDNLEPNPYQPRTNFPKEEIVELAESIKNNGLIQKITVLPKVDNDFNIISEKFYILAGERRYRAYQYLYEKTGEREYSAIEALVDNISKLDPENYKTRLMISSLAENMNRKDLTPVEKAEAISKIKKESGQTYKQIAEQLGYKGSYIRKIVSMTNRLSEKQKKKVKEERLGRRKITEMLTDKKDLLPRGNKSSKKSSKTDKSIEKIKDKLEKKKLEIKSLRKQIKKSSLEKHLKNKELGGFVDKVWEMIETMLDERDRSVVRSLILEKMESDSS